MGKKRIKDKKSRTFVPKSFLYEIEKEAKLSGRTKQEVYIDLKDYYSNRLKRKKKDYRWGTKWFKI